MFLCQVLLWTAWLCLHNLPPKRHWDLLHSLSHATSSPGWTNPNPSVPPHRAPVPDIMVVYAKLVVPEQISVSSPTPDCRISLIHPIRICLSAGLLVTPTVRTILVSWKSCGRTEADRLIIKMRISSLFCKTSYISAQNVQACKRRPAALLLLCVPVERNHDFGLEQDEGLGAF